MSTRLRKVRLYSASPEAVWEALTNPAALAEWLMPNNFEARVGATFEFRTDPTPVCGSGVTRCQVIELDRPRRMVWTWQRDSSARRAATPMRVTWNLEPVGAGTRLTLEQTGLETQGWLIGLLMSIGWSMMLRKSLAKVVSNVSVHERGPMFRAGAIPLPKRYYTCKSVPKEFLHAAG